MTESKEDCIPTLEEDVYSLQFRVDELERKLSLKSDEMDIVKFDIIAFRNNIENDPFKKDAFEMFKIALLMRE